MIEITERVEKKVRTILRAAGQKGPPTDLERVLAYLRLHHERPWHLKSDVWEGLTRPSTRGRTRLRTQEKGPTARGRWRLAHEIGHHVLHGAQTNARGDSWESHELELEADLFAAALLMPPPWVERAVKEDEKRHPSLDLESVAETFEVGSREIEKRLRQLGLLRAEVLGRM